VSIQETVSEIQNLLCFFNAVHRIKSMAMTETLVYHILLCWSDQTSWEQNLLSMMPIHLVPELWFQRVRLHTWSVQPKFLLGCLHTWSVCTHNSSASLIWDTDILLLYFQFVLIVFYASLLRLVYIYFSSFCRPILYLAMQLFMFECLLGCLFTWLAKN